MRRDSKNLLSLLVINSKALFLLTCILLIAGVMIWSPKKDNPKASTVNEKYFKCIYISADDTLWSIAEENMTEEYDSINEYIKEVKEINNLSSDKIYCGATLIIPYYAAVK